MKTERRIAVNSLVLFAGLGVAQLTNLVIVVLFARAYGPDTLGVYAFAMALSVCLCIFISLGTNSLAVREIARSADAETSLYSAVLAVQRSASVVVMLILVLIASLWSSDPVSFGLVSLLALHHVAAKWNAMVAVRFQAREEMIDLAIAEILRSLLKLTLGVAAIATFDDPRIVAAVFPVSTIALGVWLYGRSVRRHGRVQARFDWPAIKSLLSAARAFFLISVLDIFFHRAGILMLTALQSSESVGLFTAGERIVMSLTLVYAVFNSTVFPALSRLSQSDTEAMTVLAKRGLRLFVLTTMPTATLLWAFRDDIIQLLYGAGFEVGAQVLGVIAWVLCLQGINSLLGVFAISIDLQRAVSIIRFVALILLVLLASIVLPVYGAIGLAYVTVIVEAVILIGNYATIRRAGYRLELWRASWRTAVACLAALCTAFIVAQLNFFPRAAVVLAVLGIAIVVIRAISVADWRFVLQIARSRG